jgi:hypothetical protein
MYLSANVQSQQHHPNPLETPLNKSTNNKYYDMSGVFNAGIIKKISNQLTHYNTLKF